MIQTTLIMMLMMMATIRSEPSWMPRTRRRRRAKLAGIGDSIRSLDVVFLEGRMMGLSFVLMTSSSSTKAIGGFCRLGSRVVFLVGSY